MNKQEIEKSLKRYLKKRISYTFSLLIAFLITGGFATASELNQEVLLSRIKEDRAKLEKLLQENYKKEAALQKENLDILKEADFYVKPLKGTLFSMPYFSKKSKSIRKEWQGTVRTPTVHDGMREKFNSLQKGENDLSEAGKYASNQDNLSSGWINKNAKYGKTANAYDVEAKLFILPVVKAPVVKSPTAPAVSFTTPVAPTELKIDAPTAINISMGAININAPTITAPTVSAPAAITAPTVATVTVNEPNVAINIGSINVTGPQGLNLPSLTPPTVTVTVNPNTPPSIVPPNPQVDTPTAPAAPNFNSYVAPSGWWLNGWEMGIGYNTFNAAIKFVHTDAIKTQGDGGPYYDSRNINLPLFSNMNLDKSGSARAEIYAYRDENGAKSGYKGVASSTVFSQYKPRYYGPTNGGLYPDVDSSAYRPGHSGGAIPNAEIAQKNKWIFTVGSGTTMLIQNINFKIGGVDGGGGENGVLLTRNDGNLTIKNSKIELLGKTTILEDILHWGPHYQSSFGLDNVDIQIKGNENTLYSGVSISDVGVYARIDQNSKDVNWGRPQRDDGTGKKGIFGKTDLAIDTKTNAIFYIKSNASYRWNGYNGGNALLSDGTYQPWSHVANPEALMVYTPLMGRVRFENKTGSTKGNFYFNGSGNIGAWVAKYTPDRTKYNYVPATGPGAGAWSADEAPIIDLGTVHMNGDANVAIYLAQNNSRPDYNGIFQGKIPMDFRIGVNLNSHGGNQLAAGNTDGRDNITSRNVALYVTSGQRKELTVANGYFPATTNLKAHTTTNKYGVGIGTAGGTQVGYPDLNTSAHAIKNLEITDYRVDFGKYSKDNIAIVARNGSVVELNPSQATITDGQDQNTPEGDRAEGTIIGFAEGVWYNPRPAAIGQNNGAAITSANQPVVTDGRAGQKYVTQFGSSVVRRKTK